MHRINSAALCLPSRTIALFIFMPFHEIHSENNKRLSLIIRFRVTSEQLLLYINYSNTKLYICVMFLITFLTI
jgi:hypothetical protein